MFRHVNIDKTIAGEELERILKEAAVEIGLRATSVDRQSVRYRLGSMHKEEVYEGTEIRLRGRFFPVIDISGIKRGRGQNCFFVKTGMSATPYGFGSEKLVERYLKAVSSLV